MKLMEQLKTALAVLFAFMIIGALIGAVLGGTGLLNQKPGVQGMLEGALGGSLLLGVIAIVYTINDLWKEYKNNQLGNVRFLIKALRDQNPAVRTDTAKALGEMQAIEAVDPLIVTLQDPEPSVRFTAAEALGKLHDPRAVEPLITALQDPKPVVKETVAVALGELHDPRAVEPLIVAASDNNKILRNWAIRALGEIALRLEDGTMRTRIAAWLQSFAHTEDNVGTRQDAITAAEKIGVPDNIPDDVWFTVAVDRLVGIYLQHPQGFVAGEGGKQENEIRRIGNSLNERGGMELMLAAHKEFARKCGVQGAPRNLEFLWDRIGQWRG